MESNKVLHSERCAMSRSEEDHCDDLCDSFESGALIACPGCADHGRCVGMPPPILRNRSSKGSEKKIAKKGSIVWDESNLRHIDSIRVVRMKIDEPKTPFYYYSYSGDLELQSELQRIENDDKNGSSMCGSDSAISLKRTRIEGFISEDEEENVVVTSLVEQDSEMGVRINKHTPPRSPTDHDRTQSVTVSGAICQVEAMLSENPNLAPDETGLTRDSSNLWKKQQDNHSTDFTVRRKQHYNEFKVAKETFTHFDDDKSE